MSFFWPFRGPNKRIRYPFKDIFNVLLKKLLIMYITRGLRKKFWCTWAKRGDFG